MCAAGNPAIPFPLMPCRSHLEYLVLARKWRPQIFEDVLGQEHVVRTLKNAITQERIAHAFLFSGPRGVGKTSIARILAKAINCDRVRRRPPATCALTAARSPTGSRRRPGDRRRLQQGDRRDPGTAGKRELCTRLLPLQGLYHRRSPHADREAFNALLKTLEEPPAHVIFIFATTEAQKVPATILSRCQCFDFRRIRSSHRRQSEKDRGSRRHPVQRHGAGLDRRGG